MVKLTLKVLCELIQKTCPVFVTAGISDSLKGKVAVVTGGANGIGYSIAKLFLQHGIDAVTIADIDKNNGTEVIKDLTLQFGENKVMFTECDITESKDVNWIFETTKKHFHSLDIVVNSAGVMDDFSWEHQINVNIKGNIISSLLALQHMSRSCGGKGGILVNIASIMGLIPSAGFPLHTMTQFGLIGLSRSLGGHYDRTGVKVIGICPGLTESELMENAHSRVINENFCVEFCNEIEGCKIQSPDIIGEGLVKIIDRARPGSVWVIENKSNRPYEIKFPDVCDMVKEKISESNKIANK